MVVVGRRTTGRNSVVRVELGGTAPNLSSLQIKIDRGRCCVEVVDAGSTSGLELALTNCRIPSSFEMNPRDRVED